MKKKVQNESTPSQRRKALEKDVDEFLKAGNKIQYIDDGVSAQDPQGKGRPLRLGRPNEKGGTSSTENPDGTKK
jgi:hypothetical protein